MSMKAAGGAAGFDVNKLQKITLKRTCRQSVITPAVPYVSFHCSAEWPAAFWEEH